jgi:hypothetical protein
VSFLSTLKARSAERAERDGRKLAPQDFLGGLPADYPTDPVLVVVPLTIGDSDAAVDAAAKYRKGLLADLGDKAKILLDDPVFLQDAEAVEKVHRACRRIDDPSRPAFDSAQQIRDTLTTEEVAVLYAVTMATQRATSPLKMETLEDREALSAAIALADEGGYTPMLDRFPRATLVDVLVFECRSHKATRDELLALKVKHGYLTPKEAYGDFVERVAEAIGIDPDKMMPDAGPIVEPAEES